MLNRDLSRNFDCALFIVIILIFLIGLLFLYSAVHENNPSLILKQLVWMGIGLFIFFIIVNIGYRRLIDFAYPLYVLNILLLVLVLIVGDVKSGAKRWLDIGILNFQPSEFSKIVIILTLARWLGSNRGNKIVQIDRVAISKWRGLLVPFLLTLIPIGLILKEPDLGSSLVFLPILFSMLYMGGAKSKHLLIICGIGLLLTPLFWSLLEDYQKRRLFVFVNPNIDPLGAGYTVIQSKIAIGSGKLFGKGWLEGTQNQLNFLPERHTDFIFSVVGEEWGFLGGIILVLLYFLLIKRGLLIANQTKDGFGSLMSYGLVSMLTFHIFVNIGMNFGLMPVVGLPLPFISYGGSSLVITMISIALLINAKMRKPVF